MFAADEELDIAVRSWTRRRKYHKLLDMWSRGLTIDWELLYDGVKPPRVSLPVYPFARKKYWLPATASAALGLANIENLGADVQFEDECLQTLIDDFADDQLSIEDAVRAAREVLSI